MSIDFLDEDPDVKWKFAFSVQGRRIIARIGNNHLVDELAEKSRSQIIEALHSSITSNQSNILAEYNQRNSVTSNPQYVLTRQGLIHYAH